MSKPWYMGSDNGPKNWDLVPDPPRDGPPIIRGPLTEVTFDRDQKIRCKDGMWCPSCKLIRKRRAEEERRALEERVRQAELQQLKGITT